MATVETIQSSPYTPCAEIGTRSVPSTVLATRIDVLAPSKDPELGAESRWTPTTAGQTVASVARGAKESDVFQDFDVLDAGLEPLLDELAMGLLTRTASVS